MNNRTYPYSFRDFLMARVDDDDPIGDVAREVMADTCSVWPNGIPKASYEDIYRHAKLDHRIDGRIRAIFQEARDFHALEKLQWTLFDAQPRQAPLLDEAEAAS